MINVVKDWINNRHGKLFGSRVMTFKEAYKKYPVISLSYMYFLMHNDINFANCVIKSRGNYFIKERPFRKYIDQHWINAKEIA